MRHGLLLAVFAVAPLFAQGGDATYPPANLSSVGVAPGDVVRRGGVYPLSGTVTLSFVGTPDIGAVQGLLDGDQAGPLTYPSAYTIGGMRGFSATWNTTFFPEGLHLLTAIGYTESGQAVVSTPQLVRITNTALPAPIAWGGTEGDKHLLGDVDGDGIADPIIVRVLYGDYLFWFIHGSRLGDYAVQFGLTGDEPIVGDMDGDGRLDLVTYNPVTGLWTPKKAE